MKRIQAKQFVVNANRGSPSQENDGLMGSLELPSDAIVAEKQVRVGYVALQASRKIFVSGLTVVKAHGGGRIAYQIMIECRWSTRYQFW